MSADPKLVKDRKQVEVSCPDCDGFFCAVSTTTMSEKETQSAIWAARRQLVHHRNLAHGAGPEVRYCACGGEITRKPGPGRWPTRCEGCRS